MLFPTVLSKFSLALGLGVCCSVSALPQAAPPPATALSAEMRGDIYMARKMYREAIEMYKPGAANSSLLANKTGIAYHQMLDLANARKYYEKSIKLDPRYSEAINNLGTVYYAAKSYRRAVEQYKRALRHSPTSASIYSNLGTAYFARKQYKEATAAYEQALSLDPQVFEHRGNGAGTVLQERSVEERAKFHYFLAKAYAKKGSTELALQYIRKALEEGFKERDKFVKDPEFAPLQEDMEFKRILAAEYRTL
jgi:tetratricopeptide (TPR) repeat protein